MSLRELQTALAGMVLVRGSSGAVDPRFWETTERLDLSDEDRAWLREVAASPGFGLTCTIQRWWRRQKRAGKDRRAETCHAARSIWRERSRSFPLMLLMP